MPTRLKSNTEVILTDKGFGYADGYYQARLEKSPLAFFVSFQKESHGLIASVGVSFPVDSSGFVINPVETGCLYTDGTVGMVPEPGESSGFWNMSDRSHRSSMRSHIDSAVRTFVDIPLMLSLYRFLIGASDGVDAIFSRIDFSLLTRKSTPNRLLGMAAYLALESEFQKALLLLKKIPAGLMTDNERKLIADCERGCVHIPPEREAYFDSIGASTYF